MRTSNPAFGAAAFQEASATVRGQRSELMTIDGAVNRTGLLTLIMLATAAFVWSLAFASTGYDGQPAILQNPGMVSPFMMIGGIGGFVLAMVSIFKPQWSGFVAPAYAGLEGLFVGGFSAMAEMYLPGAPTQAALLTIATLVSLLMAYKAGVIKVTDKFRSGVVMATGGIALAYLISFVAGLFGFPLSFMHDSSPLSIGISVVVIAVAAMNLLLDFDMIEQSARAGAPKYMEWYCGMGLLITLIWLYIEFLRLLMKLQSRD